MCFTRLRPILRCRRFPSATALGASLAIAWLLTPNVAWAQATGEHESETIEVHPFVEPYRPEQSPELAGVRTKIVQRTNEFRHRHNRGRVDVSPELSRAADRFAQFMARTDRYGHEADGRHPQDRAESQGYANCILAENIAYDFNARGFSTAQLVDTLMDGWESSPPHRRNLLDPDVDQIGVGVAESKHTGVFYAVQMFGRPRSERIEFSIANKADHLARYRLGDKEFRLPPQYTRTHELCRPTELRFERDDEFKPTQAVEQHVFQPNNGTQYTIQSAGDNRYTVDEIRKVRRRTSRLIKQRLPEMGF